jgi:hypothetical protein
MRLPAIGKAFGLGGRSFMIQERFVQHLRETLLDL